MATPPAGDVLDRLDVGPHAPRRNRGRWLVPVAFLAVGGLVGWVAHAMATPGTGAARTRTGPALIAGSVQQNLQDPFGPAFVVSLTNTGRSALEVLNVTPRGWDATTVPVRLPAGQALEVPMDVSVDCGFTPPPSDVVVVRVATPTGARSMDLTLPEVPVALQVEYLRRCSVETLADPKRSDLVGTWSVVDGGPAFTGKMFVRFAPGGRFTMNVGPRLSNNHGAVGRYSLAAGLLTLRTHHGGDCGPRRHRAVWDVGMRADGSLHIRQLTGYDGFCTVERGDVWIAERVS